jgi:hypothetical protein
MLCLEAIANSLFCYTYSLSYSYFTKWIYKFIYSKTLGIGPRKSLCHSFFSSFFIFRPYTCGSSSFGYKNFVFFDSVQIPATNCFMGKKKKSYKTRKSKKKKTLFYLGWIFLLISIFLAKIFAYLIFRHNFLDSGLFFYPGRIFLYFGQKSRKNPWIQFLT